MAAQPRAPALRILLTRPAEQGARLARDLRMRHPGADVLESPLLMLRFLSGARPAGDFAAVLFTSESGVRAARALGWALPRLAWCVGDRTAAAARQAGFDANSAAGDADALVAALVANPPAGAVLHLHGRETRGEVVPRLTAAGIATSAVPVYAQEALPLSAAARAWLDADTPVVAPIYSPRTAALFALSAVGARAPLWIAALSPAVAAAAPPAARLAVAVRPDAGGMCAAIDAVTKG
ncbi:MAG TPA: uroporphyrinogen-III synthase [Paracoccaceae bacterium]|nr:uroporphyrinogen-III synthase [Paracoccaceae bacterium]